MYKSVWYRVLICLSVVVVLSLSVLPLITSAEQVTWPEESPTFNSLFYASIESPGGMSESERVKYTKIVDDAYKIGLFGGAFPVSITMAKTADENTGYRLEVQCIPPIYNLLSDQSKDGVVQTERNSSSIYYYRIVSGGWRNVYIQNYYMSTSGDWQPFGELTYTIKTGQGAFTNSNGIQEGFRRVVAVRPMTGGTSWNTVTTAQNGFTPNGTGYRSETSNILLSYDSILANFQQGVNTGFSDGYELGQEEGYDVGFQDGYTDGYTEGLIDGSPQMIEIETIITAVPQGLKAILDNSLDFEIFGVNVAGLLSVLLIVSIVGFVVKWLMTR